MRPIRWTRVNGFSSMDFGDLPSLGNTIRRVMALDSSVFLAYQSARNGFIWALGLVALAGASKALGQSIILFINHIPPFRFGLALLIGVSQHVIGFLLWSGSVWLVGAYAFGTTASWSATATAVGVAYAPQILAFFELTPFFGNAFGLLLSLWSLLAIVVGVQVGLGLTPVQAILASGLGWLLLQVWGRTLGRPINALGRWIERKVIGAPLQYTWKDVPTLRRAPGWQHTVQTKRSTRPKTHTKSHAAAQKDGTDG